jgi:hypothetical protein
LPEVENEAEWSAFVRVEVEDKDALSRVKNRQAVIVEEYLLL